MPANRFAILDGQVYPVNNYAEFYALQDALRKAGLSEIELRHWTPDNYRTTGIYVHAY